MLGRLIILLMAATVMLVIAAVWFCDEGEVGKIDGAGQQQFMRGEYMAALETWETGLRAHPDSCQLNYRIGTMLAVRGNFTAAREYLRRAMALNPDRNDVRKEYALVCFQEERLEEAERELKAIVARENAFPEAHFYLGLLYEKTGRQDEALEEYVQELNENPACTFAWAKVQTWEKKPVSAE
jgi:tetratricopeptide (TPR) repeat protein